MEIQRLAPTINYLEFRLHIFQFLLQETVHIIHSVTCIVTVEGGIWGRGFVLHGVSASERDSHTPSPPRAQQKVLTDLHMKKIREYCVFGVGVPQRFPPVM